MKCVGVSPVIGPPNAWRSASLLIAALSARRTSGLSNGGRSVLTARYRTRPVGGVSTSWSFWSPWDTRERIAAGSWKSPDTSALPSRIWRDATSGSLPSLIVIESRYAGL